MKRIYNYNLSTIYKCGYNLYKLTIFYDYVELGAKITLEGWYPYNAIFKVIRILKYKDDIQETVWIKEL